MRPLATLVRPARLSDRGNGYAVCYDGLAKERVTCVKRDEPLLAMLAGIAMAPVIEIWGQMMKRLGLTTRTPFEVLSLFWIRTPSWTLGVLTAIGVTAWIGLLIYLSLKIIGRAHVMIKGMIVTMTAQSLIFIVFGTLGGNTNLTQPVIGNYVHAGAAALGGLTSGYLIERYVVGRK